MADDTDRTNVPQATVVPRSRARISVVWIIPILAAVVALGIAVQRILSEGPTITIVFKAAEGLEAGKTVVKYKDVNIGQVTAVQLSSDHTRVEVTAKMDKSVADLMVEDAKFWVVEPRITLSGISGLGTLLSGNFIGFEVGRSAKKQRRFVGLETPPVITGDQPGRQFVLRADSLGSLGIGSPIYYRRLQAGQVVAYDLASDGKAIDVKIFVNAPYDQFVTPGTRFWNASGIDVSVGAGRRGGAHAVHRGPDRRRPGLRDAPLRAQGRPRRRQHRFHPLWRPGHRDEAARCHLPALCPLFHRIVAGAVRGRAGHPPGPAGGEVTDVGLDIDRATLRLRGRVEIVAFPERLVTFVAAPSRRPPAKPWPGAPNSATPSSRGWSSGEGCAPSCGAGA